MINLDTLEAKDLVAMLCAELREIQALQADKAKTNATFNKKIKEREERVNVLLGQVDGSVPLDAQLPLLSSDGSNLDDKDDEEGA